MLSNYVKIAFRNITRRKGYAFINITGLAVGLAGAILMLLWVADEASYDGFHEKADRLYRVTENWVMDGDASVSGMVSAPLIPALVEEVPEIARAARAMVSGEEIIKRGDATYSNDIVALADPDFFEMFTFPLVEGDPALALSETYSVVVSKTVAKKYFGDEDPIGQTLSIDRRDFTVSAVMSDLPHNSHLQFDVMLPFDSREEWLKNITDANWGVSAYYGYIELVAGASTSEVARKATEIARRNMPPTEGEATYGLQPIERIHLHHDVDDYLEGHGSITYVYLFGGLALLTLAIACMNFMNLATARSSRRAREVGVRKVVGARRGDLALQFLGESIVLASIALAAALVLVELFLPFLNSWSGKELGLMTGNRLAVIGGLVAITVLTGLVAGSYPALFLSSFAPARVLKTGAGAGGGRLFRRVLVATQFALSIGLIVATLAMYSQMSFVAGKGLGFDREQLVYFNMRGDFLTNYANIKQELLESPAITGITSGRPPVRLLYPVLNSDWEGKQGDPDIPWTCVPVGHDYIEMMGMTVKQGRPFSPDLVQDVSQGVLINETAARLMGIEDPIGKRFEFGTHRITGQLSDVQYESSIVGVVEDFHHGSLHTPIEAVIMYLDPEEATTMCARLAPGMTAEGMEALRSRWAQYAPDYLFEHTFADETLASFYASEDRMSSILYCFTGLAVFVTCLGLFGLASFAAERRTKEIGVRKVLGASVSGIAALLCKEFAALVVVAGCVASPVAVWAMSGWLEEFAYRLELGWAIPVWATALALVVALATVLHQAVSAARANPVKSLK